MADQQRHAVLLVATPYPEATFAQKQAATLQRAGWTVTIVARRRYLDPERLEIDGVRVELVEVRDRVTDPAGLERYSLRSPFAYRSRRFEEYADGRADAAMAAARTEIDERKAAGRDTGPALIIGRIRMSGARLRRTVVDRRLAVSAKLRSHREANSGVPDRIALRWWRLVLGDRAWTRLDPGLWNWELDYAPAIDRLRPDVIQADDARVLPAAVRAKARAAAAGRDVPVVWVLRTRLGFTAGYGTDVAKFRAAESVERACAPEVDLVLAASPNAAQLADAAHGLSSVLVLDAPIGTAARTSNEDLRTHLGLPKGTPLLVHPGPLSPTRPFGPIVRALATLDQVHLAILSEGPQRPVVARQLRLAERLGVRDRVHVVAPVGPAQIVGFLSSADAAVFPANPAGRYELDAPGAFYDGLAAGLPVVVPDLGEIAEVTRRNGVGEVYPASKVAELAGAIREVLAAPARYRDAISQSAERDAWSWEHHEPILLTAFDGLRGNDV